MDFVQKSLADYLETKRMIFPRFYFLSDDELLEILAQTKNVRAVQPYLNKCFENMKQLRFEEDMEITRMYSAENEEVYLRPSIYPVGNVENWLGRVRYILYLFFNEYFTFELSLLQEHCFFVFYPGRRVNEKHIERNYTRCTCNN